MLPITIAAFDRREKLGLFIFLFCFTTFCYMFCFLFDLITFKKFSFLIK